MDRVMVRIDSISKRSAGLTAVSSFFPQNLDNTTTKISAEKGSDGGNLLRKREKRGEIKEDAGKIPRGRAPFDKDAPSPR
jgi:hypothetical protein